MDNHETLSIILIIIMKSARVYPLCFICHTCQLHMPAYRDLTIDSFNYEMTYFRGTHGGFTPCCRKRIQVQENLKDYWDQ